LLTTIISLPKYLINKVLALVEPPPWEFQCEFVRSPVQLLDGTYAEGFVAKRVINGEKQYRNATEDEIADYVTLHSTP